jgi:hypothetical protein
VVYCRRAVAAAKARSDAYGRLPRRDVESR